MASVGSDTLKGTKTKRTPSKRNLTSNKDDVNIKRKDVKDTKTPKKQKETKNIAIDVRKSSEGKKDNKEKPKHKDEIKKEEVIEKPKEEIKKEEQKPPSNESTVKEEQKTPSKTSESPVKQSSATKSRVRPTRPMRKKEEGGGKPVVEVRQSTLTKGKTVRATIPSDPNEIKEQFEKVMEAMGVNVKTRDDMRKMGLDAQWMFVLSNQQRVQALVNAQ